MHDAEVQQKFIQLRALGQSFDTISKTLEVSKGTLVAWSRKFRFDIQNLRAIEMEALQEQLLASREKRARDLAEQLRRIEAELGTRDLADVPTPRLYGLADSLRRQILQETGQMVFGTHPRDILPDEYRERPQEWQP